MIGMKKLKDCCESHWMHMRSFFLGDFFYEYTKNCYILQATRHLQSRHTTWPQPYNVARIEDDNSARCIQPDSTSAHAMLRPPSSGSSNFLAIFDIGWRHAALRGSVIHLLNSMTKFHHLAGRIISPQVMRERKRVHRRSRWMSRDTTLATLSFRQVSQCV